MPTIDLRGACRLLMLPVLCCTLLGVAAAQDTNATGTRFTADRDMQAVLDMLTSLNGKPIESLQPAEARRQPTPTDAVKALLVKQGRDVTPSALVPGINSSDIRVTTPAGELPARIYVPDGKGPFPVIVYFHGGGWVLANREVYDGGARGLAKAAEAVVLSVDYRLAPEHRFPAQHEDALATYRWVEANAASIGGDPKRLSLAGESAGGNLALATAIAARDLKLTQPMHVLVVYPIAQASNLDTPSYRDSANAKPLNKAMMEWFATQAFGKASDRRDPRIDLVGAKLEGLPPVTLINAQIDPLRSDGEMLAAALKKAGVEVEHRLYPGTAHEFFGMAAVVEDARNAQAFAGQRMRAERKIAAPQGR